jgi:hypothetical protein
MTAHFALKDISLNPRNVYAEALNIRDGALEARLTLAPFRLDIGSFALREIEGDGALRLSGSVDGLKEGWAMQLAGKVDRLTPARLLQLWPESVATGPRSWVDDNLTKGILTDLSFAASRAPGSAMKLAAGFDFSGTDIRYLPTMPPIADAAGHASLVGKRFSVTATQGTVTPDEGGAMDVAGTSFVIPDASIRKAAPGEVHLRGEGAVTAVISLLNRKPLEVLKDTPLPVDVANGTARVSGTLNLPLKAKVQFPEMQFAFEGDVQNVNSDRLVPGHVLKAETLAVRGDQSGVEISGSGTISGIPAQVAWRQPIGVGVSRESQVKGTIEISKASVDAFGIGLPPGSVDGLGQGSFTLNLAPKSAPKLTLRSNLRGVRLALAPIGWRLPAAATGTFELAATLGNTARVDRLALNAPGLTAEGQVALTPDGGLSRAEFSRVRAGAWLDAPVVLLGRGRAAPGVVVRGGTVDLRQTTFGEGGGSANAGRGASNPITLSLNRLRISDSLSLTDFQGSFSSRSGFDGTFRGKVNGQTEVTGKLTPDNGRSAVQVTSQDAGGVFRAAGILSQGRGGTMNLFLRPVGQAGQYNGTLRVSSTRVKDAPAMAALLNAASIIGLLDEMAGQGIQFTQVEAKFRLGPQRLTLIESSAVGPSIGLSMDGVYDLISGRMDMRGVISPLYLINAIGSPLTRKGEGLIGFNYRLRGTGKSPRVQVNPLSALTPGFFREVLRPPRPSSKAFDGDVAPKPRKTPRVSGEDR